MKFVEVLFGAKKKPARPTAKKHIKRKSKPVHKHILKHTPHHKLAKKMHKHVKHGRKLHKHKKMHKHRHITHRHKARILREGISLKLSEIKLAKKAIYIGDTLSYAVDFFSKNKCLVAPVANGRTVVGLLTLSDLTDAINYIGINKIQNGDKTLVSRVMQKKIYYIQSSKTVSAAIEKMISENIDNLVVFNKKDFVGILNRDEIFSKIAALMHKDRDTPSPEIETDIDDFYFKIMELGKASVNYLAKILNVPRDTIEEWGAALAEHGMIEIVYSPFGNIKYKLKKRAEP